MKKENQKLRLDNNLIEIFKNLPKSTNTAMSWLLLHKSMEESLNNSNNLIKFNLVDFVTDYNLVTSNWVETMNLKKSLIRDFNKLENSITRVLENELGEKIQEKYYFFQHTKLNLDTLEVEVKLNDSIYKSVSSIPNKNYFQFLKQEAILVAKKKLTPNDLKLLMFLKSKSHNAKESYVKINIIEIYEILGKSEKTRFSMLINRHIDPFIARCLDNTNYVISYEVQKNKLNKRKIESILFRVDNRKERISIVSKQLDSMNPEIYEIGSKAVTELADKDVAKHMIKHENEVKAQISEKKWKNQLKQEKMKTKSEQKEEALEELTEAFDLFKFE